MKKLFSVLAVLFVLGTVNVFAWGIGPEGGTRPGYGGGSGGLSLKIDGVPCVFGLSGYFGSAGTSIGVTADWWIANPKIERTWGYYYGVGVAGSFATDGNKAGMFVGGRFFAGTNVFFLNNFMELYLQGAWQPGIFLTDPVTFSTNGFPVNIGLRFWF